MQQNKGSSSVSTTLAAELFEQAEVYRRAAATLQGSDIRSHYSALPIRNLYAHAIELYLKSILRSHGHTLEELGGKYRNDFRRIKKRAEAYGLRFIGPDKIAIEYFVRTPLSVRLKYSSTLYYSVPAVSELDGLCQTLKNYIGARSTNILE